jgi:hypothetical protein
MKSLIAVLMGVVIMLLVFSCATVPSGPLSPGEVRLISMYVPHPEGIRENFPFVLIINFEADGKPEIKRACFYWSGDGPSCFKVIDVDYGSPGTIRVEPLARRAGSYVLETYVQYIRDGKTQQTKAIRSSIIINPA